MHWFPVVNQNLDCKFKGKKEAFLNLLWILILFLHLQGIAISSFSPWQMPILAPS